MRMLGFREAKQAAAHELRDGLMQVSVLAEIDGERIVPALLRKVLFCLHQRHPSIRGRLVTIGGEWHFSYDVPFESIPFDVVAIPQIDADELR